MVGRGGKVTTSEGITRMSADPMSPVPMKMNNSLYHAMHVQCIIFCLANTKDISVIVSQLTLSYLALSQTQVYTLSTMKRKYSNVYRGTDYQIFILLLYAYM